MGCLLPPDTVWRTRHVKLPTNTTKTSKRTDRIFRFIAPSSAFRLPPHHFATDGPREFATAGGVRGSFAFRKSHRRHGLAPLRRYVPNAPVAHEARSQQLRLSTAIVHSPDEKFIYHVTSICALGQARGSRDPERVHRKYRQS